MLLRKGLGLKWGGLQAIASVLGRMDVLVQAGVSALKGLPPHQIAKFSWKSQPQKGCPTKPLKETCPDKRNATGAEDYLGLPVDSTLAEERALRAWAFRGIALCLFTLVAVWIAHSLSGSPSNWCPFTVSFLGGGFPKMDDRETGTLIPSSLLEDLVVLEFSIATSLTRRFFGIE